jgi:hypothetical protein
VFELPPAARVSPVPVPVTMNDVGAQVRSAMYVLAIGATYAC